MYYHQTWKSASWLIYSHTEYLDFKDEEDDDDYVEEGEEEEEEEEEGELYEPQKYLKLMLQLVMDF